MRAAVRFLYSTCAVDLYVNASAQVTDKEGNGYQRCRLIFHGGAAPDVIQLIHTGSVYKISFGIVYGIRLWERDNFGEVF